MIMSAMAMIMPELFKTPTRTPAERTVATDMRESSACTFIRSFCIGTLG